MLCTNCGNKNPEGVKFCIQCGVQIPTAPAPPKEIPPPIQYPTPYLSGLLPAYRPFGIVFAVVYSALSSLGWFGISVYVPIAIVATQGSPFEPVPPEAAYASFFVVLFCSLFGMLFATGAVGLWLLTRWGRNLVALLQLPNVLLGIITMAAAVYRPIQASGLSGILVLLSLIEIAFSIAIMIYLISSKVEAWFREG